MWLTVIQLEGETMTWAVAMLGLDQNSSRFSQDSVAVTD